jgi:predicted HD superfamily hydrolase involved in NAD metabolism
VSAVRYEDAVEAIEARLGKKAAKHCKRVAEAAAELAQTYGVDVEAARLAGVLHDWDREQGAGALLGEAEAAGIEVTASDAATPHLLHARTGAIAARAALPGLSDEVVSAISRHTLGAPDMTPLDMVIYLADMIESHRDYPGVETLREAVGDVALAEVFALGYRQSVSHLVEARKRIHPITIDVWNAYVAVNPHE